MPQTCERADAAADCLSCVLSVPVLAPSRKRQSNREEQPGLRVALLAIGERAQPVAGEPVDPHHAGALLASLAYARVGDAFGVQDGEALVVLVPAGDHRPAIGRPRAALPRGLYLGALCADLLNSHALVGTDWSGVGTFGAGANGPDGAPSVRVQNPGAVTNARTYTHRDVTAGLTYTLSAWLASGDGTARTSQLAMSGSGNSALAVSLTAAFVRYDLTRVETIDQELAYFASGFDFSSVGGATAGARDDLVALPQLLRGRYPKQPVAVGVTRGGHVRAPDPDFQRLVGVHVEERPVPERDLLEPPVRIRVSGERVHRDFGVEQVQHVGGLEPAQLRQMRRAVRRTGYPMQEPRVTVDVHDPVAERQTSRVFFREHERNQTRGRIFPLRVEHRGSRPVDEPTLRENDEVLDPPRTDGVLGQIDARRQIRAQLPARERGLRVEDPHCRALT